MSLNVTLLAILIAPLPSFRPMVILLKPSAKALISDLVRSKLFGSALLSLLMLIFCPVVNGCRITFLLPVTELSPPNKLISFAVKVRLLFPVDKELLKVIVPMFDVNF